MHKLCRRACTLFDVAHDEAVVEILAALSSGLPGEITRLAPRLKRAPEEPKSLADTFRFHWVEDALVRWETAFAQMGRLGIIRAAMPKVVDDEALSVLIYLRLCTGGQRPEMELHPALTHLTWRRLDQVLTQFSLLASRWGMEVAEAWMALAALAADCIKPSFKEHHAPLGERAGTTSGRAPGLKAAPTSL